VVQFDEAERLESIEILYKTKATLEHLREFKSVENSKISRITEAFSCLGLTCLVPARPA